LLQELLNIQYQQIIYSLRSNGSLAQSLLHRVYLCIV